jgi:uncharacterized protein
VTARAAPLLVAGAAATIAAWVPLHAVAWPSRLLAVFLLVGLPLLLVAQARLVDEVAVAALPRSGIYLSSALFLWVLAAVAAAAAWLSGAPDLLSLRWIGIGPTVVWAAALTGGASAIMAAAHLAGLREAPLLAHLLPRTPREKLGFAGLSLTAGVCEEVVFRGFLLGVLLEAASSPLAVVLSAGAFALVHAYQRPGGALRAGTIGVLLAAPVLVHQTIWPAVIAHVVIDLVAGLVLRDRLLRS